MSEGILPVCQGTRLTLTKSKTAQVRTDDEIAGSGCCSALQGTVARGVFPLEGGAGSPRMADLEDLGRTEVPVMGSQTRLLRPFIHIDTPY